MSKIEVGDRVLRTIVSHYGHWRTHRVCTVERETPTQIILDDKTRWKKDTLRQIGGGWARLEKYDPAKHDELLRETRIVEMRHRVHRMDASKLTDDQIERIHAITQEPTHAD